MAKKKILVVDGGITIDHDGELISEFEKDGPIIEGLSVLFREGHQVHPVSTLTEACSILTTNSYDVVLIRSCDKKTLKKSTGVFNDFLDTVSIDKTVTKLLAVLPGSVAIQPRVSSRINHIILSGGDSDSKLLEVLDSYFSPNVSRDVGWIGIGDLARKGIDATLGCEGLVRKVLLFHHRKGVLEHVQNMVVAAHHRSHGDIELLETVEEMKNRASVIFVTLDASSYKQRIRKGDPIKREDLFEYNASSIANVAKALTGTKAHIVVVTNPVCPIARLFFDEMVKEAGKRGVEPPDPHQISGYTLSDTIEAIRQVYNGIKKQPFWNEIEICARKRGVDKLGIEAVKTIAIGTHSDPFIDFRNTTIDGVPLHLIYNHLLKLPRCQESLAYVNNVPLDLLFSNRLSEYSKFRGQVINQFREQNRERIKAGSTSLVFDAVTYLKCLFEGVDSVGAVYWTPKDDPDVMHSPDLRDIIEREGNGGHYMGRLCYARGNLVLPRRLNVGREGIHSLVKGYLELNKFYDEQIRKAKKEGLI